MKQEENWYPSSTSPDYNDPKKNAQYFQEYSVSTDNETTRKILKNMTTKYGGIENIFKSGQLFNKRGGDTS